MPQEFSHQVLTSKTWVSLQGGHCGASGGQRGTGVGLFISIYISPANYHHTNAPQLSSGAGTIGIREAAVPRDSLQS
jgi:hypothetical protein